MPRPKRKRAIPKSSLKKVKTPESSDEPSEDGVEDSEATEMTESDEIESEDEPLVKKRQRGSSSKKEQRERERAERLERSAALKKSNERMKRLASLFESMRNSFVRNNIKVIGPFMKPNDVRRVKKAKRLSSKEKKKLSLAPLVSQPPYINGRLRPYQLEGVRWLLERRSQGVCPILADEMGLGKTFQTIAFLSYITYEVPEEMRGPCLVVCPLSVLQNWVNEIKKWSDLRAVKMHSADHKEREGLKPQIRDPSKYDIVVTTYEMLVSESNLLCSSVHWNYVVLDEGHRIKNRDSKLSSAVAKVRRVAGIVLTGTPLQNNMRELWAVLTFLCPNTFRDPELFEGCFNTEGEKMNRAKIEKAHVLLHLFLLRRLKKEVTELPKKIETNIMVSLSEMQKFLYKKILLHGSPLVNELDQKSEGSNEHLKKFKRLANLLMELRKCCNHPYMFDGVGPEKFDPMDLMLITASNKFKLLDRLLVKLHANGHRVLIFSQFLKMLNLLERFLIMRKWRYLRLDGSTNRVLRTVNIRMFNAPDSEYFCFILQTRSGGLGINLQTADTVILFDSDWNPQQDLQAMARVHRIGQKNVVHVYRFITAGSIEERILSRQRQKLYLDKMITRDSTSTAESLTKIRGPSKDEMLSTLKFGANAVFTPAKEITDQDLDRIIDRKRDLDNEDDSLDDEGADKTGGQLKRIDTNASNFDAFEQLLNLREFEGQLYTAEGIVELAKRWQAKAEGDKKTEGGDKKTEGGEKGAAPMEDKNTEVDKEGAKIKDEKIEAESGKTVVSDKENKPESEDGNENQTTTQNDKAASVQKEHLKSEQSDEVKEGENEGPECAQGNFGRRSSRKRKRRVVYVNGVPMLNDTLFLDPDQKQTNRIAATEPRRRKMLPGRDYPNSTICGNCWSGGDLLCCDFCPAAYHTKAECLGYEIDPEVIEGRWSCTLHECCVCSKKAAAVGGALFKCVACPLAYCDEHLHTDAKIVFRNEVFETLGMPKDRQAIWVECSKTCSNWLEENKNVVDDVIKDHEREKREFLEKKQKEEEEKLRKKRDHDLSMIDLEELEGTYEPDSASASSEDWEESDDSEKQRREKRRKEEQRQRAIQRAREYNDQLLREKAEAIASRVASKYTVDLTKPFGWQPDSSQVMRTCSKCAKSLSGKVCVCGAAQEGADKKDFYLAACRRWLDHWLNFFNQVQKGVNDYMAVSKDPVLSSNAAFITYLSHLGMFTAQLKKILEDVHRTCSGIVTDPSMPLNTAEVAITAAQRNAQDLSQSISSVNQSLNVIYKRAQQQKQAQQIAERKRQQILFARQLQEQRRQQILMMQRLKQQMDQQVLRQKLTLRPQVVVNKTGSSPVVQQSAPNASNALSSHVSSSSSKPSIPGNTQSPQSSSSDKKGSYIVQMVQLSSMGFTDKEANLRALRRTNGDVIGAYKVLKDPDQRKSLENEPLPPG
mmetsp:Transcript_33138/g.64058  ORF Transcript_33138/g.64058 Transcript_33138/m.64058 type:complete len:1446 (-) Transcript_33138:75-4412(-)